MAKWQVGELHVGLISNRFTFSIAIVGDDGEAILKSTSYPSIGAALVALSAQEWELVNVMIEDTFLYPETHALEAKSLTTAYRMFFKRQINQPKYGQVE